MKGRDSIPLSTILAAYAKPEVVASGDKSVAILRSELLDLRKLVEFAKIRFTSKLKSLRSKPRSYTSALQGSIKGVQGLLGEQRPRANERLAYDTLSTVKRETVEFEYVIDHRFLAMELKLKLCESQDVSQDLLENFDSSDSLSVRKGDTIIKVGLALEEGRLVWTVREALYKGNINADLLNYYASELIPTIRYFLPSIEQAQCKMLHYVERSLKFVEVILLVRTINHPDLKLSPNELTCFSYQGTLTFQEASIEVEFSKVHSNEQPLINLKEGQNVFFTMRINETSIESTLVSNYRCVLPLGLLEQNKLVELWKQMYKFYKQIEAVERQMAQELSFLCSWGSFCWNESDQVNSVRDRQGLFVRYRVQQTTIMLRVLEKGELICEQNNIGPIGTLLKTYPSASLRTVLFHAELRSVLVRRFEGRPIGLYQVVYQPNHVNYELRENLVAANRYSYGQFQRDMWNSNEGICVFRIQIDWEYRNMTAFFVQSQRPPEQISKNYLGDSWQRYIEIKKPDSEFDTLVVSKCIVHLCNFYFLMKKTEKNDKKPQTKPVSRGSSSIKIVTLL